jgi:hypothetical protein
MSSTKKTTKYFENVVKSVTWVTKLTNTELNL